VTAAHVRKVFTHSQATLAARLVLLAVAGQIPPGADSARLSVAEMAHRARLSRRQTIAAVRQLEDLGELVVLPGYGAGPTAYNTQVLTLPERPAPREPARGPGGEDQARRRALRRGGVQRAVWDADGWTCQARLPGCTGHMYLTIGHKVPIENDGTDDLANLQTECTHCNTAKGAR
jgi:HNH endonuclease